MALYRDHEGRKRVVDMRLNSEHGFVRFTKHCLAAYYGWVSPFCYITKIIRIDFKTEKGCRSFIMNFEEAKRLSEHLSERIAKYEEENKKLNRNPYYNQQD